MQHSTQPPAGTEQEDETYAVSAILRAAREASNESLEDVAKRSCISRRYLEALEEGRFGELPGNTYTLGFIRTYADHLGLDGIDLVNRYKVANENSMDKTGLYFPEPMPESGIPGGAILFAGIVVAVLAYGGWYLATEEDISLSNLVSPVPDRLAEVEVIASKPVVGVVEIEPAAAPEEPQTEPVETPGIAARPESEPEISEAVIVEEVQQTATSGPEPEEVVETGSAVVQSDETGMPIVEAEPEVAAVTSEETEPGPSELRIHGEEASSRILITATANSWIKVRDSISGELLQAGVLQTGDSFHVPDRPGIMLETTGNAGGLEISVDGKVVPSIGENGAVRHGVVLDPEQLKSGTAAE